VVSIDCQHISYYHFLGCNSRNIPLFLDIASPPLLSAFSSSPFFFCSGHPLALYLIQHWRPLPHLDTSGGNVTYSCLCLAESLGARRITLFGADFSYVGSRTYAKGTYIYPFFAKKQNRFCPMEALFSAFLYRSPFLPPENQSEKTLYSETAQLRFYRKKLEEKASFMDAQIIAAQGQGVPLNLIRKKSHNTEGKTNSPFAARRAQMSSLEFLEQYRKKITALPAAGFLEESCIENRHVFTTLFPLMAALKKRNPALKTHGLIEEAKRHCIEEIDRVITGVYR
jgi:hypothetical protein